ncbi:uncharacterized protein METZ01_LOCUS155660, partial [marine metagenome]
LCVQQSSSKPYFNFRHSGGGNRTVIANTEINLDEWYHIAGSWDGSNLNIYVNGNLENSQDESGAEINSSASHVIIGASGEGSSGHFDGLVDEVIIWDTALSGEQISELMYTQFTGNEEGLAGYWKFNAGEGETLYDHSGNSNHGEINGAAWDEEGYQAPTTAVTFSVNMRDYVEEFGDSLDSYGGLYVAGGNIGSTNPEDSLFMGHQMYDDDGNNIYEVTLDLERNTHYEYRYRIGPASNGNWEQNFDDCGGGYFGDRYFDTDFRDSISVGPFCWNSCENCILPNRSLSFDGVDDYVSGTASTSLDVSNTNNLTINAWVKPADLNGGNQRVISHHGNSYSQYALLLDDDKIYFNVGNGEFEQNGANYSNSVLTINEWQHIGLTYDGEAIRFYLNSSLIFENFVDGNFSQDYIGEFFIGIRPETYVEDFIGGLDEISIWNTALTQEQIQLNMYNDLSGNEIGLVGYWNFNDGEGETLTDLSPYGNHGTINGATWSNDVRQEPYYGPEWYVSTEGSDDNNGSYDYPFASVQRAIDAANDYDMVEISSGEYFENIVINKSLNIGGNNENGYIIINGNQNGSTARIEGVSDSIIVSLYGLRFTNGRSDKGGGIFISNALVEMAQCDIYNNQTAGQGSQGAGIYSVNSSLNISNCYLWINNADDLPGLGAGIYAENSLVNINDNSHISNNNSSSGSGGGIYAVGQNSHIELFNSGVDNNSSQQKGGGLYIIDSAMVFLYDSKVNDNTTSEQGGGVYLENNSYFSASDNSR